MDSDDNDFRNQNFGLAGEDNNRFPHTLRTFSLPKFNFDDHLQVQLRFDSIAGSDCLLGMQGQEDNWIEEFSPRHSAIEFSSNAAESCSITRHNNIWFDATSSESVEMLLKSVGDDDMMNQQLVNKETNKLATTESDCIIEDNTHNYLVGSNEDVVAVQLHSVGTSEDPELQKLEDKTSLSLDEKLHIPAKCTPEKGSSCQNLKPPSDKQFLEAVRSDYSLNNASLDNNLADDSKYSAGITNKFAPLLLASFTEDDSSFVSNNCLISVPQDCTDSENLKPSSAGTKCSAADEFLEVVQSDNSLHNASMSKGLASNLDSPAQKNNEPCPMLLVCSPDASSVVHTDPSPMLLVCSPDASSVVHTEDISIVDEKKKFKQTVEECSEVGVEHESENLQPDDRKKGSCREHSIGNKVGHGHVEDYAVIKDAYNMTHSSNIDPSSVSLSLLNIIGSESASSKNCDSLLGTIASHVKLAVNDSESNDKSRLLSEKMPSAVTERCKDAERESFGVDNEDPIQKSQQDTILTEHTKTVSFEEESGNSKSPMADGQEPQLCDKICTELISSSEVVVDQQSLTLSKNEKQMNEVKDGGRGKIDSSYNVVPDSAAREEVAGYYLEDSVLKSTGDIGSPQCSDAEKSSLVIDVSLSVQTSETSNLGKSNEDKLIYVEPSYGKAITNPSLDLCCASSNIDSLVVDEQEIAASQAQESSLMKSDTTIEELHGGEEVRDLAFVGIKSSTHGSLIVPQHLQSEDLPSTVGVAEVASESFLPASDGINDSNTYLPAEKNDSVNLTLQTVLSDAALCSLATSNPMEKNGENAGLDKVCIRVTESLLGTSGGTDQVKDAKFAPEDICNRHNIVQTSSVSLNISTDHPSVPTVPKKAESTKSLNFESDNQNSSESKCGSPAIINYNESVAEHPKGDVQLPNCTGPASETANIHQGKCAIGDHNQSIMSEDDGSFTFEIQLVRDPSHKDTGNDWKPFSDMHSSGTPQASAENPELGDKNSKVRDKLSDISNAGNRKKQASSPSRKVASSKSDTKGKSQQKQAKGAREKKISSLSPGFDSTVKSKTGKDVIQQYPCLDSSTSKSSCTQIEATNLTDHNVSVSSAASFHQPFTDLQQVQLRAQIFVYGSLIQGVPPDEACMVSAFGGTDGGRSLWEGSVRAAYERFSLQKSPFSTPVHSRLGVPTTEQASDSSSLNSKGLKFPSGQNSNKIVPSVAINASGYWPSPFWSKTPNDGLPSSIPRGSHLEFNQSVSPLHAYQSMQSRPCTSNGSPWLSQSPRPPLWVIPPQNSPLDVGAQYSAIPAAETVPVPTRDSSVLNAANLPLTSSLPDQGPGNLSASLELHEESQKNLGTPVSSKNESAGHISRRKKKVSSSQEIGLASAVVSQTQPECTPAVEKQISAPAISSLPAVARTAATSCFVSATSHTLSPTNIQITGNSDVQERASTPVEMLTGIEQSKIQAENASAEAATAVKLSQDTWSQLASQREYGLVSEVEKKLSSAAVAVAAAVSVAKAAAAAAKLASEAALQAKLMADDALNIEKTVSASQNTEVNSVEGKSLGWLSPTTIMKTNDKADGSNSIISAAREASRKRVEAASAATKRAENLDAILKAAELAVEAVSQAGTIISMGDPLPFSLHELVEAGPSCYWKVDQANNQAVKETKHVQAEEVFVCNQDSDESQHNEQLSNQQKNKVADVHRIYANIEPSVQSEENDAGRDVRSASSTVPTDILSKDSSGGSRYGSGMQKGSLVEVAAIEDGLRGAWFSAWVLDLKDGKAYVCYKDLLCDEGQDQLKEWIPLECDGDRAPRIRDAHPLTITKYEGTRKRRREAVGNHAWDVGDRVDVWLRDGWWEGIVTEKSLEDVTKLTVHFPAGGDSSFVRSWNLRPSLIWKDDQWVEWTHDRHEDTHDTNQGDTPHEKRRKTSQHEAQCFAETGGRAKTKNDQMSGLTKVVESSALNLSDNDKMFCMGGNVKEKDDTISNRVQRTGLQKEGSRVIFGVPKPGKKRKFMEVSKHYTSEMTGKLNENDSSKFTKRLVPKASHSWRESSRVNIKGKQITESKNRTSKLPRPQNVYSRSSSEKGNSSVASISAVNDAGRNLSSLGNLKASSKEDGTTGRKNQLIEGVSYSSIPVKVDASVTESRLPPLPVTASLKKKSTAIAEQTSGKGKDLPAIDEFSRTEDKISENAAKTAADVVEPRRSRRRIQPTSRLLEGLQSSLIMSKIPSVSHDKGAKVLRRGASSSQGHGRR